MQNLTSPWLPIAVIKCSHWKTGSAVWKSTCIELYQDELSTAKNTFINLFLSYSIIGRNRLLISRMITYKRATWFPNFLCISCRAKMYVIKTPPCEHHFFGGKTITTKTQYNLWGKGLFSGARVANCDTVVVSEAKRRQTRTELWFSSRQPPSIKLTQGELV